MVNERALHIVDRLQESKPMANGPRGPIPGTELPLTSAGSCHQRYRRFAGWRGKDITALQPNWHTGSRCGSLPPGRSAIARSVAKRTKHRSPTGRRQGTRGIGFQAPRDEPFGDSPRPSRRPTERLAETAIVQVTGTDPDGDAIARPATWDRTTGRRR